MRRKAIGLGGFVLAAVGAWLLTAAMARAADDKEEKIPDPEVVNLETHDGLQLEATYYGSIKGKDAVPVILLHQYKGSRADLDGLALYLQSTGAAVIAPDLRGHGKSTQIKHGDDVRTLDAATLNKADFEAMVTQDLQAVKKFLLEKNNEGKLNLDKLCVVGAEMGAVVAMNWTVYDWSAPVLLTGKQGQFVKAVVLLSPPLNFKGIATTAALNNPTLKNDLSTLIIVGGGTSKALDEANRINKLMGANRPKYDDKERREKQTLFLLNLKTSLEGTKLLEQQDLGKTTAGAIAQFIDVRLTNQKFPWAERKNPLGE